MPKKYFVAKNFPGIRTSRKPPGTALHLCQAISLSSRPPSDFFFEKGSFPEKKKDFRFLNSSP